MALGVLATEIVRTILVIGTDGQLAVALRDDVDPAYALIKDVRPGEFIEGYRACIPWPWMVVGCVATLPPSSLAALRRRPTLVLWYGEPPPDLPRHARTFARYSALAGEIRRSLGRTVGGMRLAVGVGVRLPGGSVAHSAPLQALIASHPRPIDMSPDEMSSTRRLLSTRSIPCRPVRTRRRGMVSLINIDSEARA